MSKVIGRLGDRMLSALLKQEEAGACVPEHGDYCGCKAAEGFCGSDGRWYWRYRRAYFDCNGRCVTSRSNTFCYNVRTGNLC